MNKFYTLLFFLTVLLCNQVFAQAGKDGARVITTGNSVVNGYSSLRLPGGGTGFVTLAAGSSTVNHAAQITLAPGDLVMIIQMQGGSGFAMDQTATSPTYGNISAYGTAGVYEFQVVQSVPNTNSFTTVRPLTNTYVSTIDNTPGANARAQVVKVPRYSSLTINAGASIIPTLWANGSGRAGGIVAIEVSGTTTINGSINANGAGFRGGVVQNGSNGAVPSAFLDYAYTDRTLGAAKGESMAGSTTFDPTSFAVTGTLPGPIYGRGAPANGGGGGNSHNAGGGGGSNASGNATAWSGKGFMQLRTDNAGTPVNENTQDVNAWSRETATRSNSPGGGRGGYSYANSDQDATLTGPGAASWGGDNRQDKGGLGGRPLIVDDNSRIFLGGGGGAGDSNDGFGTNGGNGGGIVYLLSNSVTGTGSIVANGNVAPNNNAANASPGGNDAPGGGGGGGTIIVKTQTLANTIVLNALGGKGGNQNIINVPAEAEGTGGGGGGGFIAFSNGAPTNLNVSGGANGTTNAASLAEFPANGATTGGVGLTETDNTMPNITTDLVINQTSPAGPFYSGQQITFTLTATNTGPNAATNVEVTNILPAGFTFVSSNNATYNPTNNDNIWNIGPLPATTGSATLNITAIFNANTANAANFYSNTATINGYQYDLNSTNNTSTFTYNPVNQPPLITSNGGGATASISVPENTPTTTAITTVTSTDPENNTRTYSLPVIAGSPDQGNFTINPTTGALTFRAVPNFEAPGSASTPPSNIYTIIVRATDNGAGTLFDDQTITVNVTNVNEPPTALIDANATANTVAENSIGGTPVNIRAQSTDPEGTAITYSFAVNGNPNNSFSINPSTGEVTVATGAVIDFEATPAINIIVQASDGTTTTSSTFTINVTNANESPIITSNGGGINATISVNENNVAVTTVNAYDTDANTTLSYSITGGADAARFSINPTNGELTFNTPPDFELPTDADGNNSYLVNVRVSDATTGGLFDDQSLTVNVLNVTSPPVSTDNLARNKPTIVSSLEINTNYPGSGAVDGGTTGDSRWSSAYADNQWIYVDLGATYNITQIRLLWEAAYGRDYLLQLSNNATTWNTVQTVTGNTTANAYLNYPVTGTARYVRMFGTTRGTQYGFSIYELEVFGSALNTAPTITSNGSGTAAAISLAENTTAVTKVTAADDDGNPITYSIVGGADAGKFQINPTTGDLIFLTVPDFEVPTDVGNNNVYDVIVRASDNATPALFDDQTIAVTITNANDTPVITSNGAGNTATISVAENATAVTTVTATDPDANTITYSISGGADASIFTISATGVLTFITAPNFESPTDIGGNNVYDVVVRATDNSAGNLFDEQALAITVTNVLPDTDPKNVSVSHGAAATTIPNLTGRDDNNTPATGYRFKSLPTTAQGILYINGVAANTTTTYNATQAGQLTFDPDPTFVGAINLSYAAVDAIGNEDATPAAYNINVTNSPPNTTPNRTLTVFHTAGLTTATGLAGTDPDGNATVAGFRFKTIPAAGQGILYVAGVPVVANQLYTTADANQLTYAPDVNFVGQIVLNYVAVDEFNVEDPTPATYTINSNNSRPVAAAKTVSLSHAAPATPISDLTATDNGGSVAKFRFTTLPTAAQGVLYVNNIPVTSTTTTYDITATSRLSGLSFDPNPDYVGAVLFRYTAIDNLGDEDNSAATYTINVTNIRPTTDDITVSIPRTASATSIPNLTGSDGTDGTIIGFRITTLPNPAQGTLYINNVPVTSTATIYNTTEATQLTYDPEVTFIGTATFSYTAIDNTNQDDLSPASYSINVTDVNEPPVITSNVGGATAAVSIVENTTAVTTVQASDPNATSVVKYSISGGADKTKFQINENTGDLTFISSPDFDLPTDFGGNNTYVVIVRATDNGPSPGPLFDEQEITVTVTNIDEGIVLVNNSPLTVNEGAIGIVSSTLLQFSDPEKATLTFTLTAPVVNGTLYTDTNLNNTIDAGEAKGLNATFTQAEIDAGFLKYAHNGSETITDNFSFSVTDGTTAPITNQTFTVNVTPANDPPTPVNNAILTVAEGAAGTIGSTLLQYSDSEQAASALTYNIISATVNGTVYRDANGNNILDSGEAIGSNGTFTQDDINNNRIRYVHNGSETTSDLFNFSVSDGAGGTVAGQVFNITVTPVNDPPVVVTNSPLTVNEGALGTITTSLLQYNDAEQAVTAITYNVTNLANINGTLFRDADLDNVVDAGEARAVNSTFTQDDINKGFIKYRHNGGETTAANFGFSVTDGAGGTITSQTFLINVTPVNDPPTVPNFTNPTILNTANVTQLGVPLTIQDVDGTIQSFRFNNVPNQTTQGILRVNGAIAEANTDYSAAIFPTVTFDPVFENLADVIIQYSVKDNLDATSNTGTFRIPINGEPIANDQTNSVAIPNTAGSTLLNTLNGTDDGTINTFRISVLPTSGVLYVNNVIANTTTNYAWSNRDKVQYDPAYGNGSNVTFTYIIRDTELANDASPAVFTIPIQAADQDGDGVADVNDLDDDNDGIPDTLESNGIDPSADDDNNNIANYRDPSYPNGNYNSTTMVNRLFDKDGDGIINAFDLDADGDGITDVVEQAPNGLEPSFNYSASSGRLTSPVNTSGARIGIPSSSTFAVATDLNDFDGDGLFNFLDIDADNDGLLDYLEAQATPPPAVRSSSGADNDKDGIDDTFDATCGSCVNGNGTPQYPIISGVLNSRPDYLDENSDDDLYGDAIEAFDNNSDPSKAIGYSLLDLKQLATDFLAKAVNTPAAGYYDNSADSDGDSIPDWLEDHDNDVRLNHVDPQSIYYHDSDNDGWIDLFDQDSFGSMPQVNYAFRSNTIQIPLPAELIVFAGKLEAKGVQLYWETASETNNAYYEVERSQDGVTFYSIGRVKGAGTTSNLSRYSLLDTKPLGGTSYYRLKMVNLEGGFRHSGIIAVKRTLASRPQLKAFPNPTTGEFNLDITALVNEEVLVTIMDITGQVIQTKKISVNKGINTSLFNITDVRTGTYIIIVRGANIYLVDRVVKY